LQDRPQSVEYGGSGQSDPAAPALCRLATFKLAYHPAAGCPPYRHAGESYLAFVYPLV